jgi:hypothetical protein
MTEQFDPEIFKAELEKYMGATSECLRNKKFQDSNKEIIPTIFKLVSARPIPGREHYWWSLNGKIYDPTIHQFTKANCGNCDNNLPGYFKNFPDVQDAFSEIYKKYTYYDESITDPSINIILVKWYNDLQPSRNIFE